MHTSSLRNSLKCEICELENFEYSCKICGRNVCKSHIDKDLICEVCRETLCKICGRKLSIGICNNCGKLICNDCTSKSIGSKRVCVNCNSKITLL